MAANFNTTVPDRLNPLSILPIKIPLRLFADIGTYAEAWKRNSEADRFLFDAGLHIPLLGETINIYFPVIYSSVFFRLCEVYLRKEQILQDHDL